MTLIEKLNSLVGTPYDKIHYHCYHFIESVLPVPKLKDVHVDTANDDVEKYVDLFKELKEPVNGCIVILGKSHIGIWYNGGVYHNDLHGVRHQTFRVMQMMYPTFRFYEVKR